MSKNNEECTIKLWQGTDKLSFNFIENIDGHVCKIVYTRKKLFLLTTTNNLYFGELDNLENESLCIKKTEICAHDIAANSDYLFVVNNEGHVQKIDPASFSIITTIVLSEKVKQCKYR